MDIGKLQNLPEVIIQRQILGYLKPICQAVGKTKTMGVKRRGIFCFDPFTLRGKCDLEAFKDGIMYGIEVKSKYGKLTPEQNNYREVFHKPPYRVYIEAHCLQDVIAVIK